jgi:hypothetical protein
MKATFSLLKDLQSELKEQFTSKLFCAAGDEEQHCPPHIWIGHAPPKHSMPKNAALSKDSGDPPFIVIRPLDGEIKADSSKARVHEIKIGFLCCIYSKESYEEIEAGYNDIMNMIDAVLCTLNFRVYWDERHWKYSEPVRWVMGLQKELNSIYEAGMHEHPFYGAAVVATFTAAALERPLD